MVLGQSLPPRMGHKTAATQLRWPCKTIKHPKTTSPFPAGAIRGGAQSHLGDKVCPGGCRQLSVESQDRKEMGNQLFALQPACRNQQQCYLRADLENQEVLPGSLLPQSLTMLWWDTKEPLPFSPPGSWPSTLPQAGTEATLHPGSAPSPYGTLRPFSYPHPQNGGDFCFSRRSTAKQMPVCFSARLDLQHRSPRKDICATPSEM